MTSVDSTLGHIKRFIPRRLFRLAQPFYHASLAFIGAILYGFPARKMIVIGVTGTKGKSSTVEYINAIFEEAGFKTALINTIRVKVGDVSKPESRHMTMPGRTVIQRTLARALKAGCSVAILELASEGVKQYRDRFLELNALVFTNLSPEHIESHGSYEKYVAAKLSIADRLVASSKRPRIMVANADDAEGAKFLAKPVDVSLPFSLKDAAPYATDPNGGQFRFDGIDILIRFPGEFSIKNALAAATLARQFGIATSIIKRGLEKLEIIPGRAENVAGDRAFKVIVDYAHTAESLEALYKAYEGHRRICVLGGTGGGRDTWKRPKMGAVAEEYCAHIILTNEDPYDESPMRIIEDVASGMKKIPEIILDRRAAIRRAIELAAPSDVVLITGKGSNPSICGPNGTHTPWSDALVAKEELAALTRTR